jgi:hypothetical protein
MPLSVRNLDWLRKLDVPGVPAFGARLHETVTDIIKGANVIEQQTNSSATGNPAQPPAPQGMVVVPHPQGVDVAIQHEGDFYQGCEYYVDFADNPHFQNARTQHIGQTRNAVIPLGAWDGYFQVRAQYPTGQSSAPVIFGGASPKMVRGGSVSTVSLLASEGCGTTRPGQPPGFGAPYRGSVPPKRIK